MNEGIIAIELHLACLAQDFDHCVKNINNKDKRARNNLALDTIKAKMIECEKAKELLILMGGVEHRL